MIEARPLYRGVLGAWLLPFRRGRDVPAMRRARIGEQPGRAMTPGGERTGPSAYEVAALTALLVVLGWFIIPAHWTSIWMDREFSGWCAPIGQRIAAGQRLYVDGGHSPMPPLSMLVLAWLFGSGATWITESALNYVCQGALILTLYVGLSRYLHRPIPFLAALAAIPVYLQLEKVLLYDALAQLCAGIGLVMLAAEIARPSRGRLAALAVATALCIFTKQSTGIGLLLGAALALLVFSNEPLRLRWSRPATYVAGTVGAVAILVVACSPWISPWGFVSDVLVHGSEPKGLDRHLPSKLHEFGLNFVEATMPGMLMFAAGLAFRAPRSDAGEAPGGRSWLRIAGVTGAFLGFVLVLPELGIYDGRVVWTRLSFLQAVSQSPLLGRLPITLTDAGLAISFLVVGWSLKSGTMKPLAGIVLAAVFAAAFHSLSANNFRWTYDNNPLVMIALALSLSAFTRGSSRGASVVPILVIVLVELAFWSSAADHIAAVREAVVPAPAIRQLEHARLRSSAASLVELVERIRTIAGPDDTVLVLPEDPNVEAWLERPRPRLTSSIVFVDQYWDRLVDEDFRRLKAAPPKVIAIGPQDYWRMFSMQYQMGTGAERLIDRVLRYLVPLRYTAAGAASIMTGGHTDHFDLYVRRR